jgi:hypothetical protein
LNYYLNVEFNMSKVLVFSKFYTYYYRCRVNKALSQVKDLDSEVGAVAETVFGESDDLVCMSELFQYLVDQIGS